MKAFWIPITAAALAVGLGACQGGTAVEAPAEVTPVACAVNDYQTYVGRPRTDIPPAPAGRIFRVLCSTCAATMDFRENRVNFTFDEASGRVTRVSCG